MANFEDLYAQRRALQGGGSSGGGAMSTAANSTQPTQTSQPSDSSFNLQDFLKLFLPMLQNFRGNTSQTTGTLTGVPSTTGTTGNTLSGPSVTPAFSSSMFKGPFDAAASTNSDPGQSPLMQTLIGRLNERSYNV